MCRESGGTATRYERSIGAFARLCARGHGVGDVDDHAEQRRAQRLAQVVGTQRARATATERVVHHELQGEHVPRLVPLDGALHERPEVGLHTLRGDGLANRVVRLDVVGEEGEV